MRLWYLIGAKRRLLIVILLCSFSGCTSTGKDASPLINSNSSLTLIKRKEVSQTTSSRIQRANSLLISPTCWFSVDRSSSGTTLEKSTDSGVTWTTSYPPATETNVKAAMDGVSFLNEQIGFLIDRQKLFKTTDGGTNWNEVGVIKTGDEDCLLDSCYYFSACFFQNQIRGWAIGHMYTKDFLIKGPEYAGMVLKTEDGGLTWKRQRLELPAKHINNTMRWDMRDIFFISERIGWIVGVETVFRTVDGGQSWQLAKFKNPKYQGDCENVDFLDEQFGWIRTRDYGAKEFLVTHDGGQTWEACKGVESSAHGMPVNVIFTSPQEGLLFEEQLYATKDGGKNWLKIKPGVCGDNYGIIERTRYGAIVAFCAGDDNAKPFISTDKGKTWKSP